MIFVLIALASLYPSTTLAAGFGATVDADWAGQYPYVVRVEIPTAPWEVTLPGVIISAKMVLSAAPYYNAMNAATYLMTDVDLKVHTVAKLVGAHSSFHVFKTCQPFGEARFNLTISEFVTFDASNTDAAIIFFAGNSLKSKSTTTLSDADCDTQLAVGASDIGACIEQDTTAGICSTYYMDNYDTTTFQRVPLLVVNGRVQAFCSSVNCDSKLDNDDPGYFFKMSFNRQSILNIEGIVVDNP